MRKRQKALLNDPERSSRHAKYSLITAAAAYAIGIAVYTIAPTEDIIERVFLAMPLFGAGGAASFWGLLMSVHAGAFD